MLVIPPPPLGKVANNTRSCSKLAGATLNGREEGGSDLKRERLFFSGSVSTFLQLVVPTFLKWIEPNFLSHGATLQHAGPTDGLTPDCVSPLQSL